MPQPTAKKPRSRALDRRGEGRAIEKRLRRPSRSEAEAAVRTLIQWAGDDPDREGLVGTPGRVVRSYEEFFSGYGRRSCRHPPAHLRGDRRL